MGNFGSQRIIVQQDQLGRAAKLPPKYTRFSVPESQWLTWDELQPCPNHPFRLADGTSTSVGSAFLEKNGLTVLPGVKVTQYHENDVAEVISSLRRTFLTMEEEKKLGMTPAQVSLGPKFQSSNRCGDMIRVVKTHKIWIDVSEWEKQGYRRAPVDTRYQDGPTLDQFGHGIVAEIEFGGFVIFNEPFGYAYELEGSTTELILESEGGLPIGATFGKDWTRRDKQIDKWAMELQKKPHLAVPIAFRLASYDSFAHHIIGTLSPPVGALSECRVESANRDQQKHEEGYGRKTQHQFAVAKEETSRQLPSQIPKRVKVQDVQFPRVDRGALSIESILGAGATATVHSCTYLNTPHAVKLFNPALVLDKALQRELHAAPYLQHPNIVRLYAVVVDYSAGSSTMGTLHASTTAPPFSESIVGLLMERMANSVASYMQSLSETNTEMDPSLALHWAHDVASALLFAHLQRVIHLDVKPENVLLTVSAAGSATDVNTHNSLSLAKLTDFGSSSAFSSCSTSVAITSIRGTPLYIAPEYAAGETGPTTACDVFSFGMTLWSMLHPMGDPKVPKNGIQIGMWLASGKRPEIAPRFLTNGIGDLIQRCWETDPKKRPSMGDVQVSLATLLVPGRNSAVAPHQRMDPLLVAVHVLNRTDLVTSWDLLEWSEKDKVFYSNSLTDVTNPLFQYIQGLYGRADPVKRIVMVQSNRCETFLQLHIAEQESRALNPVLRLHNFTDQDSVAAIDKLKRSFADPVLPGTHPPLARIVLGWHGTNIQHVESICRDGPRDLRTTDAGYFGAGSYFALEATYAQRYSKLYNPNSAGESVVMLFLVSVSHAYPVTLDRDYRSDGDPAVPSNKGFSNFYSDDVTRARALRSGCEHFIPVKDYGYTNPVTGRQDDPLIKYEFQACPEAAAEAHELVIASHWRILCENLSNLPYNEFIFICVKYSW